MKTLLSAIFKFCTTKRSIRKFLPSLLIARALLPWTHNITPGNAIF